LLKEADFDRMRQTEGRVRVYSMKKQYVSKRTKKRGTVEAGRYRRRDSAKNSPRRLKKEMWTCRQ
jgi:hypothetical protein